MDTQNDHGKFPETPAAIVEKLIYALCNRNKKEGEPLMHFKNFSLEKKLKILRF